MKNIIITSALALALFGGITSTQAQEEKKKERPAMTEEQKALMKEITGKYDKDGDKKLSAEERKAISPEDKAKMAKAGIGGGKGKGEDKKKDK